LARKYHPDKNPAGRDMFVKIQTAYELLLSVLEDGGTITSTTKNNNAASTVEGEQQDCSAGLSGGRNQMETVHLLMKTQVLICKRFSKIIWKIQISCLSHVVILSSIATI